MIPPALLASLPFLSSAAVSSATNLFVTGKQREQNLHHALTSARLRREELELGRRHRLGEIELARKHALESQARREEWDIILRTYPFEAGPGELAKALDRLFPDAPHGPPPVVVLERVTGDATGLWQNLHAEALVALADLQKEGLVHVVVADRPVKWPNSRLCEYDLRGRPAVVVTPTVGADRLHLMVGGCNLSGERDVLPPTPMLAIEFRHEAELKVFSFVRGFDDRTEEMTLEPLRRLPGGDVNPFEFKRE